MLNLSLALKYTEHMVYMANDMSVNGGGGGVCKCSRKRRSLQPRKLKKNSIYAKIYLGRVLLFLTCPFLIHGNIIKNRWQEILSNARAHNFIF